MSGPSLLLRYASLVREATHARRRLSLPRNYLTEVLARGQLRHFCMLCMQDLKVKLYTTSSQST